MLSQSLPDGRSCRIAPGEDVLGGRQPPGATGEAHVGRGAATVPGISTAKLALKVFVEFVASVMLITRVVPL